VSRIDRKSDAQANAEALARRESPYAANHRTTLGSLVREEPRELGKVVGQIRREYRLEVPDRTHTRDAGEDGAPAFAPEFTAYVMAEGHSASDADGMLRWSFRYALDRVSEPHRRLVGLVVMHGLSPAEAAADCGVPDGYAKDAAEMVLRKFWRGMSPVPLPSRST